MANKPKQGIVVLCSNLYTSKGKALRGDVVPLAQAEIEDLKAMDEAAGRAMRFTVINLAGVATDEDQ